jgi:ferredoxin-NADP reductase
MIRHRADVGIKVPINLLYSSRTFEDIIFRDELEQLDSARKGLDVFHTLTRERPAGWKDYSRRIDQDMLTEIIGLLGASVRAFICGPTLLVESVADGLVQLGIEPARIRTERFGPTGEAKGA